MFIKIGFQEDENSPEIETMIECKKYKLSRCEDGLYLTIDDGETIHEISKCTVWVMNDEGQTIDRIR